MSKSNWWLCSFQKNFRVGSHTIFNMFLCDMFLMIDNIDIASYADENTPYSVGKKAVEVI